MSKAPEADALAIALKINSMSDDVVNGLCDTLTRQGWKGYMRAILLDAVAKKAARLAQEARANA